MIGLRSGPGMAPPAAGLGPGLGQALRAGGYEVLGELGRGGMGVVYLARNVPLNRPCAPQDVLGRRTAARRPPRGSAPRPRPSPGSGTPTSSRSMASATTMAGPYFEMEYIEGGSLAGRLDRHSVARRRGRGAAGRGAGPRHRGGPSSGDRPPRPQAGQRPADRRRGAEGQRLRPGQVARLRRPPDPHRPARRHPLLHGPRAGRGRRRGGRPGGRRLQPGGDPLRAADGPPPVPGGDDPPDARPGAVAGAGPAAASSSPPCRATWRRSA